MSHFFGEITEGLLGEESSLIFSTDEERQEDFERSNAFRGLINDIRRNFDGSDDYITMEVDPAELEASVYEEGNEEELILTYQQNRADAYAYAAAAMTQEQRNTTPPRVNWKREGF